MKALPYNLLLEVNEVGAGGSILDCTEWKAVDSSWPQLCEVF